MKKTFKHIGVGAGISTALFLVMLTLAFLVSFVSYHVSGPPGWTYLNRGDAWFEMGAIAGVAISIFFIIKKNWWAVLGATLGYVVVLVLLAWLIEVAAGPAGF